MFAELRMPKKKQKYFSSKDEFTFAHKIGTGSSSIVYKVSHTNTKDTYAIKVVDLSKLPTDFSHNVEKELTANAKIKHRNVVKMYDVFQEGKKVYMVMEYMSGGNLFSYLENRDDISESEIKRIFKQVLDAVNYMHKKGFINRDIKLENILMDKSGNIKLCDFGEAKVIKEI